MVSTPRTLNDILETAVFEVVLQMTAASACCSTTSGGVSFLERDVVARRNSDLFAKFRTNAGFAPHRPRRPSQSMPARGGAKIAVARGP